MSDLKKTSEERIKQRDSLNEKIAVLSAEIQKAQLLLNQSKSKEIQWDPVKKQADLFLMADELANPATAAGLEKEWKETKNFYRDWSKRVLENINSNIEALQNEKDYGSTERRKEISDSMNRLLWGRDHLKRQLQELTAATAISWIQIKNRFDEWFQKLQGKSMPQ